MAYIGSTNKMMTDSGGGSVSFNYKAPKAPTYKAPVSPAKANQDTQTRYEQQQLAAQQAAQKAAWDRANAAAAIARFQQEEAARLAREAAAAAAIAAENERKRKELEKKLWDEATGDRFSRGNMPVTSAKPKQTFADVLGGLTKGWVTDVANNFSSNVLPQQARGLTTPKVEDRFTRASEVSPKQTYWSKTLKGLKDDFEDFKKLDMPEVEDRFTRAGDIKTAPANYEDRFSRAASVNPPGEYKYPFFELLENAGKAIGGVATGWRADTANNFSTNVLPQQARGLQFPKIEDRFTRDTLTSNDKGPINKEAELGFWDKAVAQAGMFPNEYPESSRPVPPNGKLDYQSYSKFMQPKGPFMPGESLVGPLQDRFTGEDKLSYQSHLPSYWEKATPDKVDFYRYPNGGEAAAEAETAYQAFAKKYKDQYEQKLLERSPDLNKQAQAGLNDDSFGGAIGMYNDAKVADGQDFDPRTAFGQRLMNELAGTKEPSYTERWALMDADIKQKTNVSNELTAAYKALLATRNEAPDMSDLSGAKVKKPRNPRDLFTRVLINGRTFWLPNQNLSFADDYPWETSLTDYRPPERFTDAGHKWKEAKDYGWQPEVGPDVVDVAPVADGSGDGGYGGYGSYGYGSGGSYWSPSGYYDNQYAKDRYGSFQNLAKWVI